MSVSAGEMSAVREAILQRQGEMAAKAFDRGSTKTKEHRVAVLEESAALYIAEVNNNGNEIPPDPLAVKVVDAAKKAGRISARGEYTGPDTDAVAAKDPQTATNACC